MKKCQNLSNIDIVKHYYNGTRPFTQVSLFQEENKKYRNEGDTWKDKNGTEWTKKNGKLIKLTKTQGDLIRDFIGNRVCKCGLNIKYGNKFDNILFSKTGMCQDCLADYETKLMIVGLFPLYEKYKILCNELSLAVDFKSKVNETIEYFSKNDTSIQLLCNSEGYLEKFSGTNKENIIRNAKDDLKLVNNKIKSLKKEQKEKIKELKTRAKEFKIKIYV